MYRVWVLKTHDVTTGENLETVSANSINKGQELKSSTCRTCGHNEISSWKVKGRMPNTRFLMCLGVCVSYFKGVFEVGCTFSLALGLWVFNLVIPL